MEAMQFTRDIQAKNKAAHKSTTRTYVGIKDQFRAHRETLPQPTRISQNEMEERREK